MIVRALNSAGAARFIAYLAALRTGVTADPPREILCDDAYTSELAFAVVVEEREFADRAELGAYLCERFMEVDAVELERLPGLWAWLSLLWFDQLCPRRPDGTRRPGLDYRHVPDFRYRTRYRHLLYGPYQVYRRHGATAAALLSGPVRIDTHLYQTITGRQDFIGNRGVVEAVSLLYHDPQTRSLKRGCQPSEARPGTVRRFVRVLQQLDLTYDVYGMTGREIVQILPGEFEYWRAQLERRPERGDEPVAAQGDWRARSPP